MPELNVQTTLSPGLDPQVQTFYDQNLIKNTKPLCVYAKFGQKRDIPKRKGQTIEFHRLLPFPKATRPLTEGVVPDGSSVKWIKKTAKPKIYGDYVTTDDYLDATAVDNQVLEIQENQANQAGETLDYITGLTLCGGVGVQYAGGVKSRNLITKDNTLTAKELLKARTTLVNNKAAKIDGKYYVAIAHPSVCYDLMQDPDWVKVNQFSLDGKNIYDGNVGKIHGVLVIEDPNAIVFNGEPLTASSDRFTIVSVSEKVVTIAEPIESEDVAELTGKKVLINGIEHSIVSTKAGAAGTGSITLDEPTDGDEGDAIISAGGGFNGCPIYPTLVFGANAYGVTKLAGMALQTFVKGLGSGGTSDPLDQISTVGWKASHCAEILVDEFMVRIETAATELE